MYKYFLSLIGLFIVDRLTKVYFLRNSSLPGGWGEFFSLYFNIILFLFYFLLPVLLGAILPTFLPGGALLGDKVGLPL